MVLGCAQLCETPRLPPPRCTGYFAGREVAKPLPLPPHRVPTCGGGGEGGGRRSTNLAILPGNYDVRGDDYVAEFTAAPLSEIIGIPVRTPRTSPLTRDAPIWWER